MIYERVKFKDFFYFSEPTRKRSERLTEKEKILNETPLEDVEIPPDWACIFYFHQDKRYVKLKAKSPRWPGDMKHSEKICLDEGDIIMIKCNKGNDEVIELEGEFKIQGPEKVVNKALRKMCSLREDGVNASKIVGEKVLEDEILGPQYEEVEQYVPCSQGSKKAKYPKTRKDIEMYVEGPADDPDFDLDIIDNLVNQEKLKDQQQSEQGCSGESNARCRCSENTAEEVRFYVFGRYSWDAEGVHLSF